MLVRDLLNSYFGSNLSKGPRGWRGLFSSSSQETPRCEKVISIKDETQKKFCINNAVVYVIKNREALRIIKLGK